MKCERCGEENPRKHSAVCGFCEISLEILEADEEGRKPKVRFGVQGPSSVPKHYNYAIGEEIEDREDYRKKMQDKVDAGVIEGYE